MNGLVTAAYWLDKLQIESWRKSDQTCARNGKPCAKLRGLSCCWKAAWECVNNVFSHERFGYFFNKREMLVRHKDFSVAESSWKISSRLVEKSIINSATAAFSCFLTCLCVGSDKIVSKKWNYPDFRVFCSYLEPIFRKIITKTHFIWIFLFLSVFQGALVSQLRRVV